MSGILIDGKWDAATLLRTMKANLNIEIQNHTKLCEHHVSEVARYQRRIAELELFLKTGGHHD